MRVPRWPALVILAAAVVGLILLDQREPRPTLSELTVATQPPLPFAVGGDAMASTWYCAGGTGTDGGAADHTVTVLNPTDEVVRGTIEVYGTGIVGDGSLIHHETVAAEVEVAPQARTSVRLGDLSAAGWVAALVELESASVVVTHHVEGPTGTDHTSCASAASGSWYFPAGSTRRDARQVVAVFNPFPDDAVIDVTFATDDGTRAPQAFDGVPVPAGTLVPLDVTEVVARWPQLSMAVETRTGRVIADRVVTHDGTEGLTGLTVGSGAPRAAPVWVFAEGAGAVGTAQSYAIYNPSADETAEVDVEIRLDSPETNGAVEPFEVSIPPRRRVVVGVNLDGAHPVSGAVTVDTAARVPAGVGHTVTVRSFNGIPVVAEQLTTSVAVDAGAAADGDDAPAGEGDTGDVAGGDTDAGVAAVSAPGLGVTATLGSPATATMAVLEMPAADVSTLAVMNPSFSTIARVTVSVVVDGRRVVVEEFDDVEIGPQRRLEVRDLAAVVAGQADMVVVEASSGVVVQRLSGTSGTVSLSSAIAVPVGGEVTSPELFG